MMFFLVVILSVLLILLLFRYMVVANQAANATIRLRRTEILLDNEKQICAVFVMTCNILREQLAYEPQPTVNMDSELIDRLIRFVHPDKFESDPKAHKRATQLSQELSQLKNKKGSRIVL